MAVIYSGPSMIDGKPIVVLTVKQSGNVKTGAMIQTHILRADIDPRAANQTGEDVSICGGCPYRGKARENVQQGAVTAINLPTNGKGRVYVSVPLADARACYVNLGQGPLMAWKAFKRGKHASANARNIGRGAMVRVGSYGDPLAVPPVVWHELLAECKGWTGYTHQRNILPSVAMTSADSLPEARAAWSRGERTFRVVSSVEDKTSEEILCPASREGGYKSTCIECKLCNGTSAKTKKSVVIVAHGTGKNNIIARA